MGIFTDPYHSLLSEGWNRLDLAVVISAWLPLLFPSLDGYTSLRALRAFRPLRAAHMLPGVRRQVNTLIKALPFLGNVKQRRISLSIARLSSASLTPSPSTLTAHV